MLLTYLGCMIKNLNGAVLEVFDHEINSADVAWPLDERLILQRLEHEVGLVQLLLSRCYFGHIFNLLNYYIVFPFIIT